MTVTDDNYISGDDICNDCGHEARLHELADDDETPTFCHACGCDQYLPF